MKEFVEQLLKEECYVIDFLPERVSEQYRERFFEIYNEKWYEELSINELADMINLVLTSSNGYMNMLSIDNKLLICIEGSTLNFSIYNATEDMLDLLSEMATPLVGTRTLLAKSSVLYPLSVRLRKCWSL